MLQSNAGILKVLTNMGAPHLDFETWGFSSPEDAVFGTPDVRSFCQLKQSHGLRTLHCRNLFQLG